MIQWKIELGKQLRAARLTARLSQAELAKDIGVSRQMWGRYEQGLDAPSADILVRVSARLNRPFTVEGFTISVTKHLSPFEGRHPRQLAFEFDREHTFEGATVRVRPSHDRLEIVAIFNRTA